VVDKIRSHESEKQKMFEVVKSAGFEVNLDRKIILITGHRRENFGDGFQNMCKAMKALAQKYSDADLVYPVHLNSNLRQPVNEILTGVDNVHLNEPLQYEPFVYLMDQSHIILTDSGGIQEEAPALGKPVIVMRNITERPEALQVGTVKLVGPDFDRIVLESSALIDEKDRYNSMSQLHSPYGDGKSSNRIIKFLESKC
jgi:UDP-N-acetylglucosamine 2-epimerase (non-hydrolysing)